MLDNEMVNLKNVSFLVMDDFYRNRSARLSDEIKRVVNETRVSLLYFYLTYIYVGLLLSFYLKFILSKSLMLIILF
jgi:hypothetical protein